MEPSTQRSQELDQAEASEKKNAEADRKDAHRSEKHTKKKASSPGRDSSRREASAGQEKTLIERTVVVAERMMSPAFGFWDNKLRGPVSTGLITSGAVLTEVGKMVRRTPLQRGGKRALADDAHIAEAARASSPAEKKISGRTAATNNKTLH